LGGGKARCCLLLGGEEKSVHAVHIGNAFPMDKTEALSERRQRRRANKRLLRKVREARLRLK